MTSNFLLRFAILLALIGGGMVATEWVDRNFIHSATAAPEPTETVDAWKIRVTVKDADGNTLDVLNKMDQETHQPQVWPTREACEAYMQTDELKNTLPALHAMLEARFPNGTGTVFECVPAPKPHDRA